MPEQWGGFTYYTWAELQQLRKDGKTFQVYGLKSARGNDVQSPVTIAQKIRQINEKGWYTDTPDEELMAMDGDTKVEVAYTQGSAIMGVVKLKGLRWALEVD